jgi:hypothetical protein
MNYLEHKVFSRLHDDTHVYPGHGDDTTLNNERAPPVGVTRARLVTGTARDLAEPLTSPTAAPPPGRTAR